MAVTAQTPFSQFTAAPGATVFSSEFRVLQASDLVVKVNGAVIASGFSVSGIGAAGGVDVTFSTPMTGGEVVELLREVPLTRATDYQQLGDFLAPVVNLDFDRLWMSQQDQESKIGSSLRLPFPEQVQELPAASGRIRKLFYFDENGDPVFVGGTPGTVWGTNSTGDLVSVVPASGSAADLALNLASIATGKGAEIPAFDWQQIPPANNNAAWGIQTAANGVNLLRYIPPAQWSAILAGTSTYDATAALQSAVNAHGAVYIPGKIRTTASVNVSSNRTIYGGGAGVSRIEFAPTDASRVFVGADVENVEVYGIGFKQINAVAQCYAALFYLSANTVRKNIRVHHCGFEDFTLHCVSFNGHNSNDGTASGPTNAGFEDVQVHNNWFRTGSSLFLHFYGCVKNGAIKDNIGTSATVATTSIDIDDYASSIEITGNRVNGIISCGGGNSEVLIHANRCSAIRVGYMTVTGSLGGNGYPWAAAKKLTITNNHVFGNGAGTYGIDVAGHKGHASGTAPYTYMAKSPEAAESVTIVDNHIYDVGQAGVNLDYVRGARVSGNWIQGAAQQGVLINGGIDCKVKDNDFVDCGATAAYESVRVTGTVDYPSVRVQVRENRITNDLAAKNYEVAFLGYTDFCEQGENTIDPGATNKSLFCLGFSANAKNTRMSKNTYVREGANGLVSASAGCTFIDGDLLFVTPKLPLNTAFQEGFINSFAADAGQKHQLLITKMVFLYETNGAGGDTTTITLASPTSAIMATVSPPASGLRFSQIEVTPTSYFLKVGAAEPLLMTLTPGATPNTGSGKVAVYGCLI